jgi:2-methylcitrate dehydratase PrpD
VNTEQRLARTILDIAPRELDTEAVARAHATIADTIGVALAGSTTTTAAAVQQHLARGGDVHAGAPGRLVGRPERAGLAAAALHNGTVAHALDYDDASRPSNAHLSCSIVSALLSVAPDDELLSDEFVAAYVVGYEIGSRLGHVLQKGHRGPAWHPTGVLGPLACAAAVGRLLRLDERQLVHALGVAATCSSGLRANFGSMTKPFHAGHAARSGVTAATLALAGFESSGHVLDAETGFFRAFGTDAPEEIAAGLDRTLDAFGSPWELCSDMGVLVKFYPACAQTHPGIEAAQLVRAALMGEEPAAARVGVSRYTPATLTYHRPETGLQGKFSMEYVVALALAGRPVVIDAFADEAVRDPEVRRLVELVTVEVDPRVEASLESAAVVTVETAAGRVLEELVEFPKGNGRRWLSTDDLQLKFRDTAGRVLDRDQADRLFDLLMADGPGRPEIASYLAGGVTTP